MPIINVPDIIEINININFGRLIIEHIDSNDATVQAAIDKAEQKFRENTAALAAAEKGE